MTFSGGYGVNGKDALPRTTQASGKALHAVYAGEPASGGTVMPGGLIRFSDMGPRIRGSTSAENALPLAGLCLYPQEHSGEELCYDPTGCYHAVSGMKVLYEKTGNDIMEFRYDGNDELMGFSLNGVEYLYVRNLQGDVIGILDISGSLVVEYTYDAWGNSTGITGALANTAGTKNPYRYRGYRWDQETGLYYLQSRYYNPQWGRFLNADLPEMLRLLRGDLLGVNSHIYCNSNPVMYTDPLGYWAQQSSGFKKTNNGFKLNVYKKLLSQSHCLSFADDIIKIYKEKKNSYKGMNRLRIAVELFAHAAGYYAGSYFRKAGVKGSWIDQIIKSGTVVDVNNNDSRSWAYYAVWYAWGPTKVALKAAAPKAISSYF